MNNGSTIEGKEHTFNGSNFTVAVNSIQRTLTVERMHVNVSRITDTYLPYDVDNLYPQKVKSIAQRSGSTMSAIETLSSFISGDGFMGMDQVVNREGQTLWDITRHISTSKATFKGFALHFNYNVLGQITEINPINFEFIRWYRDLNKFVYNPDWKRRMLRKSEEKIYNPFWPEKVQSEIIKAGGIDRYDGQIYYWIPNIADYYTTCTWDSVLDDAQLEAEVKLYSLSCVQNDYSIGGYTILPRNLVEPDEIEAYKEELRKDKGAANAGGIRVFSPIPAETLSQWKYFVPTSRNNIDNLHTNQIERAKFNIYAAFRQPPILNGVTNDGMFNQESFADAFHYYNSSTETERKEVEKELNKILSMSIWSGIGQVQIIQKTFNERQKEGMSQVPGQNIEAEADKPQLNETLTNLTGRQLQGVFRITKKYKNGELSKEQASIMLKDGFGFDESQIEVWLVNDEEVI